MDHRIRFALGVESGEKLSGHVEADVLLDVQHKLMTNSAAIGELEQALASQPESVVIQANLRSLRKLHGALTKEFHRIVSEIGVDGAYG